MTTYDADVRQAISGEQQDLIDRQEHCSADTGALAGIGRAAGYQVRVRLAADPPEPKRSGSASSSSGSPTTAGTAA